MTHDELAAGPKDAGYLSREGIRICEAFQKVVRIYDVDAPVLERQSLAEVVVFERQARIPGCFGPGYRQTPLRSVQTEQLHRQIAETGAERSQIFATATPEVDDHLTSGRLKKG
ncbi:MAG: hypothetical protein M3P51_00960 [Chloroflexota bacterium]|nr:hypothetical protein [Chloroflexota bacterium]